jgi:hypothetical protein
MIRCANRATHTMISVRLASGSFGDSSQMFVDPPRQVLEALPP